MCICYTIIYISSSSYHLIYTISLKTKTKQKPNIYPELVTKNQLNKLIWNDETKLPIDAEMIWYYL